MELKPQYDEIDVRRLAVREIWNRGIRTHDGITKALLADYKISAKSGQVSVDMREVQKDDRKLEAWVKQQGRIA